MDDPVFSNAATPIPEHTHDRWAHPGRFEYRQRPLTRDLLARAFTVGVGGPVGSGKTALMLALCRRLRERLGCAP